MATYYISPDGNDANNGLGPDASHATNKPWLTLGKALNSGSTVAPGDTVWVAPGSYFGEALVPISGVSSSASPTSIKGDPLNLQGFKTAAGVRRAELPVYITTRANSSSALTSSAVLLNLRTNQPDGLTFQDLVLEGGTTVTSQWNGSEDITFIGCRIMGSVIAVDFFTGNSIIANLDWLFDRCIFWSLGYSGNPVVRFSGTNATGGSAADIDVNITVRNSLIFGRVAVSPMHASATNVVGGFEFEGNTHILADGNPHLSVSKLSTVTTSGVIGSLFVGGSAIASVDVSGTFLDRGYNRAVGSQDASANMTEAGTTNRTTPPYLNFPDIVRWRITLPSDEAFGWSLEAGNAEHVSGWSPVGGIKDFRGKVARPWGDGASIGYIESYWITKDDSSAFASGGVSSLQVEGAGEAPEFLVPVVGNESTTISVRTKSSGYGGASYPQLIVEANGALGLTQQVDTATDATEQDLSVTFTPTADGVVRVRLVSRSSSTTSTTNFDNLSS